CRRYAASSTDRSALKGRMFAGMTPEKRSGRLIIRSLTRCLARSYPTVPLESAYCPATPSAGFAGAILVWGEAGRSELQPATTGGGGAEPPSEGRKDLPRDDLDLLGLVAVGDQDQPVDAGVDVGAELGHALVDAAADRVVDRGFAPRGHVPLGLEPV